MCVGGARGWRDQGVWDLFCKLLPRGGAFDFINLSNPHHFARGGGVGGSLIYNDRCILIATTVEITTLRQSCSCVITIAKLFISSSFELEL